jgi:hypothetical protein
LYDPSIGINCNVPRYALDVLGDINASGAVRVNNVALTSDQRVKQNIVNADVSRCFSTMKMVDLKYFQWESIFQSTTYIRDSHQLGFIAQDIKPIFPNSVLINSSFGYDDFHALDYHQINAMHYGATKKLMDLVEQQGSTLHGMQQELSTLRG